MRNTNYRAETFSPFDLQGTEEHLSAMAAQGWRLESIGRFFWRYRRAEPAGVHYAVACPPAAGESGDLGERLYFEELCAAAGWKKVTDWAALQIYANEAENPIPLETDEAIRLESVHQSMRRTYLRTCWNNLIYDLLLFLFWLSNLWTRLHTMLLSNFILGVPLVCLLMAAVNALSIAGYVSWYRRSLRSAEEGGGLAAVPRSYRIVNRLPAVILVLLFLIPLPLEFLTRNAESGFILMVGVITSVLSAALAWGANRFLEKRGCDGYTRAAAMVLGLLALLAVSSALADGLNLSERVRRSAPEAPSYTWDGQEWDLEPQALPLTLEDLTGLPWDHVRRTVRTQGRTLFASEMTYTETAARGNGTRAGLYYVITDVPNDRLCRAVLNDIQNGPSFLQYRPEDPGPWGAEEACRLEYPDGGTTGEWLVQWPGRVAAFRTEGLDLTPEQKAVVGARLAPEGWKEEAK